MTDDPIDYFRRLGRRNYLRRHEQQRRAVAKAEGARRIDVTLRGKTLEDYRTIRRYIEGLNRLAAERNFAGFPIRLSDTEIIKMALRLAAEDIRENEERARRQGLRQMLSELTGPGR